MDPYLERANEIIGDRSREEELYDNEVVKWLKKYGKIRKALNKANKKYPDEALKYNDSDVDGLFDRYEYLMNHQEILAKMGR